MGRKSYISAIHRNAKKRGIFWDTETGGLWSSHDIFSSSTMPYKGSDINTKFMSDANTGNFTLYSKNLYSEAKKSNAFKNKSNFYTLSEASAKDVEMLSRGGAITLGHNLGYDITALSQHLSEDKVQSLHQAFDIPTDRFLLDAARGSYDVRVLKNKSMYSDAFARYSGRIYSRVERGAPAIVDSMHLTQFAMGMAHEKGIVNFGGDLFTGSKMEVIGKALGLASQMHDESDVAFNKPVMDWAFNATKELESYSSKTPFISDKTKAVLEYIKDTQGVKDKGLAHSNLIKSLSEIAAYKVDIEEGRLRTLKGHDFYAGTYGRSLDGNKIYSMPKGKPKFVGSLDSAIDAHYFPKGRHHFLTNPNGKYGYTKNEIKELYNGIYDNMKGSTSEKSWGMVGSSVNIDELTSELKGLNSNKGKFGGLFSEVEGKAGLGKVGKLALVGAGLIAASTLYSIYSAPRGNRISGKDDDYNTIEGLHPGGGVNKANIRSMTDFGSGWQGLKYSFIPFAMGATYGWKRQEKKYGHVGLGAVALSLSDDAALLGFKLSGKAMPDVLTDLVNSKAYKVFESSTLGYTAGSIIGKYIYSKDDMHRAIRAKTAPDSIARSVANAMLYSSDPHPSLSPSYNSAKDVYRFQEMRASKIGLSEEDMYKYMTQENPEVSDYVKASAAAGTALHELIQSSNSLKGKYSSEELVWDSEHKISGHVDEQYNDTIFDIKTKSHRGYSKIAKYRNAPQMNEDQMMFYLGIKGKQHGALKYVDRTDVRRQTIIPVRFDPKRYEQLVNKVSRVRSRVEQDIASGKLNISDLPKAASIETLRKYQDREHPGISLENRKLIYEDEMAYLGTTLPKRSKAADRAMAASTQGLGLQIFNNQNQHHRM